MRQDQFDALQERAEQLIDLFLEESNPEKWPGHGIEPMAMEKQTRGDRYWCKKDAVATLACAQRIGNLIDLAGKKETPSTGGETSDDLEKEIRDAEKEATAILNKAQTSAKRVTKQAFDKKVHGNKS